MCVHGMVPVTPVNENCLPQWKVTNNVRGHSHFVIHRTAQSPEHCRQACLFNPQCVACSYRYETECFLYGYDFTTYNKANFNTYTLVKRCDITPGFIFYVFIYVISLLH